MPSENPPLAAQPPHPALVLGVYGEELAHGARTAIFGSATIGLAEELAQRGARLVHLYDIDAGRVAEATARSHDRSIFYALLPEGGDVGVRDGAFDFVLVPDLSLFADPAALVALVRRVVSPLGAALIASPNNDAKAPLQRVADPRKALGYYELYEAIAAHFPAVRMIGQAPFVGYAVAELSVEDPEPTIDSSLAESEGKEPDWFVALASDRNLRLDPFALIELPVQPFAAAVRGRNEGAVASPPTESAAGSAGTGTVLINILEAEREAALESLRQQEQALQVERFRADRAVQELAAAREEVDLLRERCRALDERVGDEETRRLALETRLEHARVEQTRHEQARVEQARVEQARVEQTRIEHARVEQTRHEQARVEQARIEQTRHDPELATLRERVRVSEERVRASEERVRVAEERVRGLETSVRLEQARHDPELTTLRERVHVSEERARALEASVRGAGAEHEEEVTRLETQLRERGHEIQELRAEVDRRDKLVRELVMTHLPTGVRVSSPDIAPAGENGSPETSNGSADTSNRSPDPVATTAGQATSVVADLSARLDRLANDAARREADLVGARWRIAQLERELMQQR